MLFFPYQSVFVCSCFLFQRQASNLQSSCKCWGCRCEPPWQSVECILREKLVQSMNSWRKPRHFFCSLFLYMAGRLDLPWLLPGLRGKHTLHWDFSLGLISFSTEEPVPCHLSLQISRPRSGVRREGCLEVWSYD
jgi:hypothetical protein